MLVTKESFNQLKELLNQFEEVHNSPYSESFYDRRVGWGEKPEGTLRCSDHWNYTTEHDDLIHSITDIEVREGNWAIGKYVNGIYEILWQSDIEYHKETYARLVNETEKDGLENRDYDVNMISVTSSDFEPNKVVKRDWNISIWSNHKDPVILKGFRIQCLKEDC